MARFWAPSDAFFSKFFSSTVVAVILVAIKRPKMLLKKRSANKQAMKNDAGFFQFQFFCVLRFQR